LTEESHILIAGAGIAGLTAALTLARHGLEVTIAEAFDRPSEVGAGLQIAPNATRILRTLGVLDALEAKAIAPASIRLGDASSGRILLDMPITKSWLARMDAPYLTAHRALLHGVLYDAARAHPSVTLLTGHSVKDVREGGERVTTTFSTADGETVIESRILIGADGIWSKVRDSLIGAGRPKPTGRIAWRAIGPGTSGKAQVTAWMAPDSHIVTYPVRNEDTLNIVAITKGRSEPGQWAQEADQESFDRLMKSAREIEGFDAIEKAKWTVWPLNSVDPDRVWHGGRVLLIGDAAHGLEPFAAQGAAMAIEDGYTAGRCIAQDANNPRAALPRYTALRRERVREVAKRTAFNRWVYHQSGPGRLARNLYFSMRPAASFITDLEWLYGYRIPE
jgi:salicylate hydroxylase